PARRRFDKISLDLRHHHAPYSSCHHSLWSRLGFIFHRLAVIEGFETLPLDNRMMNHHIAAARFGCNKTKTLLVVKPFHLPHRHLRIPFLSLRGSAATMSRKDCPFCTSRPSKLNNNHGQCAKQDETDKRSAFCCYRRPNHFLAGYPQPS